MGEFGLPGVSLSHVLLLSGALTIGIASARSAPLTTLDRLKPSYLAGVRSEIAAFAAARRPVAPSSRFLDVRCVLHAHSKLSHDSRGTVEEIAAAARSVGVRAVFLTDHPKAGVDVIQHGPSGLTNGVLFVPGAETRGFLIFPGDRRMPDDSLTGQALVDHITRRNGLIFVSHPEEHKDWSVQRLTGMEIYNTHANFMESRDLLDALQPRTPDGYERLLGLLQAIARYPQESFGAFFSRPSGNLARYDAKAAEGPFTAIAANDSHQNVGYVFRGAPGGRIFVEDALGERVAELDIAAYPRVRALLGEPVPDRELMRTILDPYAVSFHYVSTHVLARSMSETDLRTALQQGRTYVAFDWIADPTGAVFEASSRGQRWTLGDTIIPRDNIRFSVGLPLPAIIRAFRNGAEIASARGRRLTLTSSAAGQYRFEASLPLGGELRPWIYTGAIRIAERPPARERASRNTTQ